MNVIPETFAAFSVDDVVRFPLGPRKAHGVIIEDRGPIGVQGRRIYRVRVDHDPDDSEAFEMPGEEMELVPADDALARPIEDSEAVDYLQRGGLISMLQASTSNEKQIGVWLRRDSLGNVTHTFAADRGLVGGAVIPSGAVHNNRVSSTKKDEVSKFVESFGLGRRDANAVLKTVGTAP